MAGKPVVLEELNWTLREHQVAVAWDYQEAARFLHDWFDRLNDAFFEGALPPSCLCFEGRRGAPAGAYRPGRSGVGVLHELHLHAPWVEGPRPTINRQEEGR